VNTTVFRSTFARIVVLAALAAVAVFATSSSAATSVDKAAAALVPANIKAKGTLIVAADASYAPNEFIGSDGHTVVGMDPDLANALFPLLGLKVKIVNATFGTIIAGMLGGKYDIGMSSFTDTKAREKQVNFVDYFEAGTSFASICGLTVSVETGTTERTDALGQATKCTKAGKKPDTVLSFNTQTEANLALHSGRAQISMADSPVAGYQVAQSHGAFKLVGQSYGVSPYGIAVPKADGTLDKAILVALKQLVANGQYAAIMKKWGLQSGSDTHPALNGAIS
jgi:polar amino acid transport system substrate-binding protein